VTPRPYVLLDRDGTLVVDPGYVHRVDDFALLPGVVEGLRALTRAGFRLAIVTNQSGIGRGRFTEADFARFQRRLLAELAAHGLEIDGTFHCPHAPDVGCVCRKPATGLIERARGELDIDLSRSWIVGDSDVDMELAARAGCRAVRVGGAAPSPEASGTAARSCVPLWAPDLAAAASAILARLP
jgi:histidinol-phosphate phosphatase family protein